MKLRLRDDLGGYAMEAITRSRVNGTSLDRPFVLFTGHNGAGKSAIMRAMRASIGLRGERGGATTAEFDGHASMDAVDGDVGRRAVEDRRGGALRHVPAIFDVSGLGWSGQSTYYFDSRAVSGLARSAAFDADMLHHVSMIASGGAQASHGEFVKRVWNEALVWAAGDDVVVDPWRGHLSEDERAFRDALLAGREPSGERWLFLDEPETAIDAEALTIGLCALLEMAEIGRLRVFCASHSLLFAAGLATNPKMQTVDLGGPGGGWMATQRIVLDLARDPVRIGDVGRDVAEKLRLSASDRAHAGRTGRRR